jgi:hypothetical protein
MADDRLEPLLQAADPGKRALLRKLVLGTAFAVPMVASYSVKDLAVAQQGSPVIDNPEDDLTTTTF